jgi:carbamoyl-phosphate synthase large subunit
MPRDPSIRSVLVIGSGPIVIGQACEFDYSGTQAIKVLRKEGIRVSLVNSNPATIMTDPEYADRTYIEPLTPEIVEKILERERPDAVLPTVGGQTALNLAVELSRRGVLDRLGIRLIGASRRAVEVGEDRKLFKEAMGRIGLDVPKSGFAHTLAEARAVIKLTGLPAVIRPSFTLGGTGGGIAYTMEEFEETVERGLDLSPTHQILIEESVIGWKEYELEVMRDNADNFVVICSIENFDPMGIHTGDSVTVAPAQTLTDREFQQMRNAARAIIREVGVETGGSNVQFAVDPKTGRMVVIEMNPRVSRSSALASKATGFPIAKVAAKLAVGYTLDELTNDITGVTPASFEPTIDYVVTKIPRFAFEKFPGSEPLLTTAMKSVGEAMAIGRSFPESLQKALRSLETGLDGLDEMELPGYDAAEPATLMAAISPLTPDRLLRVAQAMRLGLGNDEIADITAYDPWFLNQIRAIVDAEARVKKTGLPTDYQGLMHLKSMGFSDAQLARLTGREEAQVTALRHQLGIRPTYKRIDTCAGEFEAQTPYMYSTYEHALGGQPGEEECESRPTDARKVAILGGGPNRIGQGIEFDYCCVHAAYALSEAGFETIMVNCNPETVSTDYDTSDRLYFEPLTAEDVIELLRKEQENGELLGVIVQFGGQTPLKLARELEAANIPILGTSPDAIDLAEDRERFQKLLNRLNLKQPPNGIATSQEQAVKIAEDIGFPVVIRPSYVLGGRAMEIVRDVAGLERYMKEAVSVSGKSPVLIDFYLSNATEVDVDAVSDGRDVYIAGILEHIEEAGIHSGDSACSLPPYSLSEALIAEIKAQTIMLAKALEVVGLMNVQFAIQDGTIYILEVNPRASRTVPFIAKATKTPIAKIAARVMAGEPLASFNLKEKTFDHVAVKEAVFPFARFPGVDTLLGPEMRSTGEVMGLDRDFEHAFFKSQLAAGTLLPEEGKVFVSVKDRDKEAILPAVRQLLDLGLAVVATRGTAQYLKDKGLKVEIVNKVLEGRPHIVDAMKNGEIALVLNTTEGSQAISDSYTIRRTALLNKIPYYTTVAGSRAAVQSIASLKAGDIEVAPLQSYD